MNNKLPIDMAIKRKENELYFDYNISRSIEFSFKKDDKCGICKNEALSRYIAPFASSQTPLEKVCELVNLKFGIIITPEDVITHRKHIRCVYKTEEEIEEEALQDLAVIESDISGNIDEDKLIESQIRQLWADSLRYKQAGEFGKAIQCSNQLHKWVVLKKTLKKEMPQGEKNVMLADIINIGDLKGKKGKVDGTKTIDIKSKRVS